MVLTVDISIDQIVNCSVSFNLNNVDCLQIPIGQDKQLEKLFREVLNSQCNTNFSCKVCFDFDIKLLEVLTLTVRVRSVFPQSVQADQQLASGV